MAFANSLIKSLLSSYGFEKYVPFSYCVNRVPDSLLEKDAVNVEAILEFDIPGPFCMLGEKDYVAGDLTLLPTTYVLRSISWSFIFSLF